MSEETATLTIGEQKINLPIVVGNEGERAIDISQLRKETGYITLDPGYISTGSCRSTITFINGEKGILRYRGYPIEQLAEKASFVEVAYLLIFGNLPNQEDYAWFSSILNQSSLIHEDMRHFFDGFPNASHPMALLSTIVASLSQFYPTPETFDQETESQFIANLISQVRTIAAFSYKKSIGEPVVYPSYKRKYVENFLIMMFSSPVQYYEIDEDIVRALEVFLILHADHEQNCSASTVRMVGSSRSNIYSAVSAGISALWGPLHGGANQEVIKTLEWIKNSGKPIPEIIEDVKNKRFRLMGFGHRVYKNFDPRARILKKYCDILLNKPGTSDPLFDIAKQIEEIALKDDYFIGRNLYPNVDFYSGLILRAIGIPYNMFTVLFAIGRMPGWLAQWKEMYDEPNSRISRPRQVYTGAPIRDYVPLERR